MMNISSQWHGTILASLSAILFGFVGLFGTELILDHFTISNMLFWRFLIASLTTATFIYIKGSANTERTILRAQAANLVIAATLYCMASSLYFISTNALGTGLAVAILFCFPVFVTIFSYLFGNYQIDKFTILSLTAIISGIALIHGRDTSTANWTGVGYSVLTALVYATYIYRSRAISKVIEPVFLTLLVCVANTIIFFVFSQVRGEFMMPSDWHEWFFVFAIGMLGTALPIQLLLESLKYITAVKASILASQQVIVTVLLGWLVLNEQLSLLQLCGIIIMLMGSIMIQQDRKNQH